MKRITIFSENGHIINLEDLDDRDIQEYTSALARLLENNNITILHTTSTSVIIRPNTISSIIISNDDKKESKLIQIDNTKEEIKTEEKTSEPPQDIITD